MPGFDGDGSVAVDDDRQAGPVQLTGDIGDLGRGPGPNRADHPDRPGDVGPQIGDGAAMRPGPGDVHAPAGPGASRSGTGAHPRRPARPSGPIMPGRAFAVAGGTLALWIRAIQPKPRLTGRKSAPSSASTCQPDGRASGPSNITRLHFTEEWRATLYENGLLAASWPRQYGGGGLSPLEQVVVAEEFYRAGVPTGGPTTPSGSRWSATPSCTGAPRSRSGTSCRASCRARTLVPGVLGARGRIGPGQPRHPGRPRRRRVGDRRAEDLDVGRPVRQLDLRAGPHQPRRPEAQGDHVPAGAHGPARRRGAPDQDDDGAVGVQRDVLQPAPAPPRPTWSAPSTPAGRWP
jgi:hypothetical protein